jgi:hypothetical protein
VGSPQTLRRNSVLRPQGGILSHACTKIRSWFLAGLFIGLLVDPEGEGDMFLQKVGGYFRSHSLKIVLYELTKSKAMSSPREAASCSTTQEFSNISGNSNIHYSVHKIESLAPSLSQIKSVQSQCFSEIHFPIILPLTSGSS